MAINKWFVRLAGSLLSVCIATSGQVLPSIAESRQNIKASSTQIPHAVLSPSYGEFPTTTVNSSPTRMALGPDGATWFVESSANNIGRITPAGAVLETTVSTANAGLAGITTGSDGAIWFTESTADKIGRITTDGVITTEFPITAQTQPTGIVSGPDGALWFTEFAGDSIGRLSTAGALKEFSLAAGSQPLGITLGPDGCIWFTEYGTSKIGRLDPQSGTIIETALTPGSGPHDITTGPDGSGPTGAIWFTESIGNKIGQVWPYSVRPPAFSVTEFPVTTPASKPTGIAPGPDGAFWFTENATSMIGRITTSGQVDEFPTPSPLSGPDGICLGPDGELWFSESNTSSIVRAVLPILQPTFAYYGELFGGGAGSVLGPDGALWFLSVQPGFSITGIGRMTVAGGQSLFPVPMPMNGPMGGAANLGRIALGPDGALWFTEPTADKIGRITADGMITEYPTSFGALVEGITSGPDGTLWFTENLGNKIGRISTNGTIREYSIPTSGSAPSEIVLGPDGALWFTEFNGNRIGRITANGSMMEFAIPSAQAGPDAITVGPDGALWFVEYNANKIGRITTGGVITEYTIPTARSAPLGITLGPDGALWFTEFYGYNVGRITADGAITEYASSTSSSGIIAGTDGGLWLTSPLARISLPGADRPNSTKIIGTNPPGLVITVDGSDYIAPQTFTWPLGSQHAVTVPMGASTASAQYSFTNWSDGQPLSHSIHASAGKDVYIANYKALTAAVPNLIGLPQLEATNAIESLGLLPGNTVRAPDAAAPKGSVISQSPAPGTPVSGGSEVDLVISSGPKGSIIPLVNGVISAGAFGAFSSVAPGSWIEIYGSNLALDTRGWSGSDFDGNNAPTSLDGVKVSIGGQPAFVDYISSTQVNAQLPSNIATGAPLPLTVANGNSTSSPFNVIVNATEPGLLAPSTLNVNGNQYVAAQHLDRTYVLPSGAAVNSRPAQPGETIVIYGVGFGPVTPNTPAGQVATQTDQLSTPFEIMFGQTPAKLPYFGLAPGFVGLYQFNVTVPAVPDSDLVRLTFNLGGASGTQILYTAVHH